MSEPKLKVFLSYPSERLAEVKPIYRFVEAMGAQCWFDKESLVGGDTWDKERADAQARTDLFLAVLSSATSGRDGVIHREINDAIDRSRDQRSGLLYIVPLRLDDVPVPGNLAKFHWIDLFKEGWKSDLARSIKKASEQRNIVVSDGLEVAATSRTSAQAKAVEVDEEDETGTRYLSYFQYTDEGDYWDYVNAEILAVALGGLVTFRRLMTDWPKDRQPSYWELHISETHRSGELVSITVGESHYFGGTIHPNHSVKTINIFGPSGGRVNISDLFDHDPQALIALEKYCDLMLSQPGQQFEGSEVSLSHYVEMHGWDLFNQFNVNGRGLILNFSAIAGLPHVFGVFEVYVPWEVVNRFIPASLRAVLDHHGMPITLND